MVAVASISNLTRKLTPFSPLTGLPVELLELWTLLCLLWTRCATSNKVKATFTYAHFLNFSQMASARWRVLCGSDSCNEAVQQSAVPPSWSVNCLSVFFRVKLFFSMRVGALVSLGMFSYLWPGSYFSVFQTRDFPLSVLALLIFKQEAKDPCQGRQYRTRAVSASYSGPDCLGPSYFVGGFCPNIQVAICPSTSTIYCFIF